MMKRAFDMLLAIAGLLVLSPLILILVLLIRTNSPGGAFFVQQRVGRDEKPFQCYKFRTMTTGAPNAGSHEIEQSWITPLGQKLRRCKLDEIPQLFNVLRGDMSLVGPRPCLPVQAEVIAARRSRNVFAVRPGITGPAQLHGIDMSMPDELATADASYIQNRTMLMDLRLLYATLAGAGSGDAVRSGTL